MAAAYFSEIRTIFFFFKNLTNLSPVHLLKKSPVHLFSIFSFLFFSLQICFSFCKFLKFFCYLTTDIFLIPYQIGKKLVEFDCDLLKMHNFLWKLVIHCPVCRSFTKETTQIGYINASHVSATVGEQQRFYFSWSRSYASYTVAHFGQMVLQCDVHVHCDVNRNLK